VPIGADAGVQRVLAFDPALFSPRPDYLLRVQGDSMRDEGILDQDIVGVHATPVARHGQVVAARVGGDRFTLTRLYWEGDVFRVLPNSPGYQPIDPDPTEDFAIEGLFAGLLRGS
jgi:repressor LexA